MRRGPLFGNKWSAWSTGAVGLGSTGDAVDRLPMPLLALAPIWAITTDFGVEAIEREAEDETADV